MDAGNEAEPESRHAQGEKRTLRAAVDGSPARPEAKHVRATDNNDDCCPSAQSDQ